MRNILHHRLAGRTRAVYPKAGTVITDTHQDVLGLASVKVLATYCELVSRQRDLCWCDGHDHSDAHTCSYIPALVRRQSP